jgi:hypothetical protein
LASLDGFFHVIWPMPLLGGHPGWLHHALYPFGGLFWTYSGLQDLKDFARISGLDVVYSEVSRERDGKGYICPSYHGSSKDTDENLASLNMKPLPILEMR